MTRTFWLLPLISFCLSFTSYSRAQAHDFIPADRAIDWSHVGIPGGIPSATWPIYKTLSPSGSADDSVAIQNAINAAPSGSVIVLNPGTYKLHRASTVCSGKSDDYASGVYEAGLCLTDKSVVLRGSGPDQTILQYGDGANMISMGKTYLSSASLTFISISSGATKGSNQITLQSASGIAPGTYLGITQDNPSDNDGNPLVSVDGNVGRCNFCGHNQPNNAMIQVNKVTAVSGNVVTLERPLYFTYDTSPKVYKIPMVENVGLENLRLQPTASSGTGIVFKNVNVEACAHCWVTNIESDMAVDRANIYLSDVYGCEISNNFLNDGYNHNSGGTYAVQIEFRASENLIQNNIIRKARHSTIMAGGSGNVFGYNFLVDAYQGATPNSLAEKNGHGAHPYMNLWEGNVTPNINLDFVAGSSSHNTLFRNYVSLQATNPTTGTPMTGGLFAVVFAYYNNHENVFGNVLGPYGSACAAGSYEINADASQNASIYKLGYYDDGGASSPNQTLAKKVGQTILRGGNWDCKTNSVVWNSNVPSGSIASTYLAAQTLPSSLYLSGKPSWFTASGVVLPPIDPSATNKVNKIPAQLCYEKGPKTGGAFKPSSCYASGSGGGAGPQPPTNLTTIVH